METQRQFTRLLRDEAAVEGRGSEAKVLRELADAMEAGEPLGVFFAAIRPLHPELGGVRGVIGGMPKPQAEAMRNMLGMVASKGLLALATADVSAAFDAPAQPADARVPLVIGLTAESFTWMQEHPAPVPILVDSEARLWGTGPATHRLVLLPGAKDLPRWATIAATLKDLGYEVG